MRRNKSEIDKQGIHIVVCPREKPDRVVTRQQLLDSVWGYSYYGDARTLDVHIRRLRQKLDKCGDCIETVVGVGYRFVGCTKQQVAGGATT